MNKLSLIQKFSVFQIRISWRNFITFSAVVAMLLANSPLNQNYNDFLNLPVSIQVGTFSIDKTLIHWINDGFMAVFFVLVGMEVKENYLRVPFQAINKRFSLLLLPLAE